MNTEWVKWVLSQYRTLQGEYELRKALYPGHASDEGERLLKQKIDVVDAMLLLLTNEERFVITNHLMDLLPWPLMMVEYERQWGSEQIRHMRTLKRFQSKALEKMATGLEKWKLASQIEELFQFKQKLED